MSRYEHGRIIAVNEVRFGSNLNGDHAAGVTSLTVEDAADFDETGGQLTINGQIIDYTTFDDDTATITLASGQSLAAAAEDGDRVDTWDPLYQAVSTEKIAQVQLDGEDDTNTDPLEATVALHLTASLDEGLRGTTGESVLLEQDGDEWRLVDVLGHSSTAGGGVKFYDQDTFTTATDGAQSVSLTYLPVDGSVHMAWGGLWQPHTEFTASGQVVTVPDPAGLILAGDVLDFRYAYRDGIATETIQPDPGPSCYLGVTMTSATIDLPHGKGTWGFTAAQDAGVEIGIVSTGPNGTHAYYVHIGYTITAGMTSITYPIKLTPGNTPIGLYMKYPDAGVTTQVSGGVQDPGRCCFYFGQSWRTDGNVPGGPCGFSN